MRPDNPTLYGISILILSTFFFGLLITSTGWMLGVPVTPWHLPLAFAAGAGFVRCLGKAGWSRVVSWGIVAFLVSILIASVLFDYSFDGQAYHQAMAASLTAGWNPMYEHHNGALPLADSIHMINDHYLRGIETLESLFYATTGWLEAGKAVNLLLAAAGLLLCLYALRQKFGKSLSGRKAVFLAILFAGCPVVTTQWLTFYIDSAMYTLLLSMLALIVTQDVSPAKRTNVVAVAMITAMAITIKLNTFFFAGIAIILYLVWLAVRKQFRLFRRIFTANAAAALLGVFFFSYSPLVTNTIDHGHPLYPLMVNAESREEAWDIMTPQTPLNMRNNNRVVNVGISLFGKMQHSIEHTKWGLPTRPSQWLMLTDMRVGGFGQFFGLALLLSFILYFSVKTRYPDYRKAFGWVLTASVLGVFVFAEGWWARYVPFLWWVPLTMMLYWESAERKTVWQRCLAKVNYTLMSLNVLVALLSSVFFALTYTKDSVDELGRVATLEQPIKVWMGSNVSMEDKLKLFNIRYLKLSADIDTASSFEWIMGDNIGHGTKRLIECPDTQE